MDNNIKMDFSVGIDANRPWIPPLWAVGCYHCLPGWSTAVCRTVRGLRCCQHSHHSHWNSYWRAGALPVELTGKYVHKNMLERR